MPRLLLSRPLWAILALSAAVAIAYGAGKTKLPQPIPEVLRAQCFELVDAHGRSHADFWLDAKHGANRSLLDNHLRKRAALQVADQELPELVLWGSAPPPWPSLK